MSSGGSDIWFTGYLWTAYGVRSDLENLRVTLTLSHRIFWSVAQIWWADPSLEAWHRNFQREKLQK